MEKQVQAVYTISTFKEFQKELTSIMYCDRVSVEIDNTILEYQIAERILIKENKKNTVIFKVQLMSATLKLIAIVASLSSETYYVDTHFMI
ncbi:hypothetical protein ACFX10_002795 [Malus domestica]